MPSVEPSSTKTTSQGSSERVERGGQLVVEQRDAPLLVVHRDDHRDHAPLAYACDAAACSPSTRRSRACSPAPSRSRRSRFRSPRRRVGCSPRTSRARVDLPPLRRARRWTGSRSARPTRRAGCRSSFRIAAGLPADRPLAPGEAMEISTGGAVPDGRRRGRADRARCRRRQRGRDPGAPSRPARNVRDRRRRRPRRRRRARGRARVLGAAAGRRARGGRASRRCAARGGRASSSSAPARSSAPPGDELGPGQIYESNGAMLAAALRSGRRRRRAARPGRGRRGRAPARARARARAPTCSSARAASRSARTTSCAGSLRRARRRGGLLGRRRAAGEAARVRRRGATLVFGLPGKSRLVARRRRALRAAGAAARSRAPRDPGPRYRAGPARVVASGATPARDELVRARTRDDEARDRARAAHRPGVAHDRPRRRRRRARARAARRGRARAQASRSATSGWRRLGSRARTRIHRPHRDRRVRISSPPSSTTTT